MTSPLPLLAAALLALCAVPASAAPGHGDLAFAAGYDTNAANAPEGEGDEASRFVEASAGYGFGTDLGAQGAVEAQLSTTGHGDATFHGLSFQRVRLLGRAHWRASSTFYAPTLTAWGSAALLRYASALRDGDERRAGLYAHQQLTTALGLRLGVQASRRSGQHAVFDTRGHGWNVDLDWRPVADALIYGGYAHYRGDVVSTVRLHDPDDPEYAGMLRVPDDAFGGVAAHEYAYRLAARCRTLTLGANVALLPQLALDLQLQRSDARADIGERYARQTVVLSLLRRF